MFELLPANTTEALLPPALYNVAWLLLFTTLFSAGMVLALGRQRAEARRGGFEEEKESLAMVQVFANEKMNQSTDFREFELSSMPTESKSITTEPLLHKYLEESDAANNIDRFSGEPVTLAFDGLHYSVPVPNSTELKPLLTDISGVCLPGQLTALMGSTGAGKTTLLDVLAGRKTVGKLTGRVLVNGQAPDSSFPRLAGYCEQQDLHSPLASVSPRTDST